MKKFVEKYCTYGNVFLVLLCVLVTMYPFGYMSGTLVLDTAVQVKTGLLMLAGQSIDSDIYSWHEGLTWVTHEKYWYLLVGSIYKYFQVPGLVVFNCITSFIVFTFISFINKIKLRNNSISVLVSFAISMIIFDILDFDIRPQIVSVPLTVALLLLLSFTDSKRVQYIFFLVTVMIISLLHCSTAMILFAVFGFRVIADLVFDKDFKSFFISLAVMIVGFIITLIGSGGYESWLYLSKQSCYPELMELFSAWKSYSFSPRVLVVVLLVLIAVALKYYDGSFNKKFVLNVGYYCMFLAASTIYSRMFLYFSLVGLYYMPTAITFYYELLCSEKVKCIFNKVYSFLYRFNLSILCLMFCVAVIVNYSYYDMSVIRTINDAAKVCAYDMELIDFIKDKGYYKIYNDFNIGTWLLFNDIKVHIDNRVDPYLASYSGEDNFHNVYMINNLVNLDDFVDRYQPDAIIFNYDKSLDTLYTNNNQESYNHSSTMCNFIESIDRYASDKYKKVYENTVNGIQQYSFSGEESYSSVELTWVIYEPVYD